jgi:hypothetical protein
MIRLDRLTRDDTDLIITGLYVLAGAIPPPAQGDPAALDLANELTYGLLQIPEPAQEDR